MKVVFVRAALLLVAVLGLAVGAGAALANDPGRPQLSVAQLEDAGVTGAIDVTPADIGGRDVSLAASGSADWAVARANEELDVSGEEVSVLRARAWQFQSDEPRDVYVVLYNGGVVPFDGPAGATAHFKPTVTGVIVDATTGAFLRGFMQ